MTARCLDIGAVPLPGEGYMPLAAFTRPAALAPSGLFLLGQGLSAAGRDYSPAGLDATVQGTLAAAGPGAVLGGVGGGYLQTSVAETAAMTLLALVKLSPGTSAAPIITNYGASPGASLYADANGQAVRLSAGGLGVIGLVVPANQWILVAARIPATGAARIENIGAGTSATTTATTGRVVTGSAMRIGGAYTSTLTGSSAGILAGIYSDYMSDFDLARESAWAAAYAATLGIDI
ncbi:hypothetical protein ACRC7T_18785 [Segnochrobactraceae bacterium EtOH-i3]